MTSPEGFGQPVTVGIDVGGTKVHCAAFSESERLVAEVRHPTQAGGTDPVFQSINSALCELRTKLDGFELDGVGIGVPGIVDPVAGTVSHAVNLGISDQPLELVDRILSEHGTHCSIANDVNAAAFGTYRLLSSKKPQLSGLSYLSIGTGVAAGIVSRGEIYQGSSGVAGEIGHLRVDIAGPVCECGQQGCLETVASGAAISREWPTAAGGSAVESLLGAAEAGDLEASDLVTSLGDHLARAIQILAVTFDTDLCVIGGGVADVGDRFLDIILSGLRRLEAASSIVRSLSLADRTILKPSRLVGVVGAAALVTP